MFYQDGELDELEDEKGSHFNLPVLSSHGGLALCNRLCV